MLSQNQTSPLSVSKRRHSSFNESNARSLLASFNTYKQTPTQTPQMEPPSPLVTPYHHQFEQYEQRLQQRKQQFELKMKEIEQNGEIYRQQLNMQESRLNPSATLERLLSNHQTLSESTPRSQLDTLLTSADSEQLSNIIAQAIHQHLLQSDNHEGISRGFSLSIPSKTRSSNHRHRSSRRKNESPSSDDSSYSSSPSPSPPRSRRKQSQHTTPKNQKDSITPVSVPNKKEKTQNKDDLKPTKQSNHRNLNESKRRDTDKSSVHQNQDDTTPASTTPKPTPSLSQKPPKSQSRTPKSQTSDTKLSQSQKKPLKQNDESDKSPVSVKKPIPKQPTQKIVNQASPVIPISSPTSMLSQQPFNESNAPPPPDSPPAVDQKSQREVFVKPSPKVSSIGNRTPTSKLNHSSSHQPSLSPTAAPKGKSIQPSLLSAKSSFSEFPDNLETDDNDDEDIFNFQSSSTVSRPGPTSTASRSSPFGRRGASSSQKPKTQMRLPTYTNTQQHQPAVSPALSPSTMSVQSRIDQAMKAKK